MNKRERRSKNRSEEKKRIKWSKMTNGDKYKVRESQTSSKEEGTKGLSNKGLKKIVLRECLSNDRYSGENVEVFRSDFRYNGNRLETGLKLEFDNLFSKREHYFGFEIIKDESQQELIKVHYHMIICGKDIYSEEQNFQPKKISARGLLGIIKEFK